MNKFIVSALMVLSTSFAYAAVGSVDPCQLPDRQLAFSQKTAVEALNSDVNIIKGTAKNIARCELKNDPTVTACLTVAKASYHHGTEVVFNIHRTIDNPKLSSGIFIAGEDDGADVTWDSNGLSAKSVYLNGGHHRLGGLSGGHKAKIDYDENQAILSFRYWSTNSSSTSDWWLTLTGGWQLSSSLDFICHN